MRQIIPVVLLALVLGGAARGFDVPTKLQVRDVRYDVRSVDLPSGMRVLIERESSRPLVAVASVVDVGGTLDPPGKEGLAHLVEHLTFRSVQDKKHPLNDLLEMSGAASWNASTGWDVTTYHSIGAKDSLPALLTLEAARLVRPLEGVTPEVFEAERQVVMNELFQRDEQGLESVVFGRLSSALFRKGHPNSRPMAGTETSIAALSLEDARDFVKRYYRPERVTLLLAGDVDPASVAQLLGERIPPEFVDAPAGGPVPVKSRLPAKLDEIPDPVSPRDLIRVQAPAEVPLVVIGWALPSGFDEEGYLEQFVARLAARASAVAVAHDPDLVSVGTTLIRGRSGSMLLCFGRLRDGSSPGRSAEAMLDQLFRTWAVVPRAMSLSDQVRGQEATFLVQRNQAYVGLASELEHLEGRAVMRAQLVHATGEVNAVSREMQSISQLSAGQVAAFAHRYLDRGRARVVFLEPNGTAAAEEGGRGAFASSTGLQLRVDRDVLLKQVVPPSAEIRAFRLDSGLEVVLARRPTAPVLSAALAVRGGSADGEPLGGPIYARFGAPVEHAHGRPDLYGMLPSNQVVRDQLTIELLAANGNLANAVGMLLDRARSFHVDSGVDSYVDRELRSVYRKDWVRPHDAFDRLVWSAVYDKHPYGRVVPPDQFDKVSSSEAQRFLDRALVPANAALSIAGDFELAEAEAMVRDYFGGWRPKADQPAFLTAPLPSRGEGPVPVVKLARPGARQTELRLGCAMPLRGSGDRTAADVLAVRIETRLHRFARQMLGATYGFGSRVVPRSGVLELQVAGTVDASGAARVLALLRSEAANLGTRPLDPNDFARAQWDAGLRASTRYEDSRSLAFTLARLRLAGLPANTLEQFPKDLADLTPAAVQAVAAECRRTAVVGLLGEQAMLDRLVPSG